MLTIFSQTLTLNETLSSKLYCSSSGMETHSVKLSIHSSAKVWSSVAINPAESWWPPHNMSLSLGRLGSVISRGLPLCYRVAAGENDAILQTPTLKNPKTKQKQTREQKNNTSVKRLLLLSWCPAQRSDIVVSIFLNTQVFWFMSALRLQNQNQTFKKQHLIFVLH